MRQLANLDLTEAQRSQIRSIAQNAKTSNLSAAQLQSQIDTVLNPQQQATLQADRSARSTVNGLTLEDLQNQSAAGDALSQQQLASELFSSTATEE